MSNTKYAYAIYMIYDETNNKILYVKVADDDLYSPAYSILQLYDDKRSKLYRYVNKNPDNKPIIKSFRIDTITTSKNIDVQNLHHKYIQLANPLLNDRSLFKLPIDDDEMMNINEKINTIIYCHYILDFNQ